MKVQKYLDFPWSTEDTIENLKELKEILQEQLRRKNYEGQGKRDAKEIALDFDRAIQALKEVEQYRALGTVEELKKAREKQKSRREWYQKGYQDGLNANKWIPCEERLPSKEECKEECGRYGHRKFQVTIPQYDGNRTVSMDFVYETVRGEEVARWKWNGRLSPWEVLAWKQLDEPYKKEGVE